MVKIAVFSKIVTTFFFLLVLGAQAASASSERVVYALFSRGWPPFEMTMDGEPGGIVLDVLARVLPRDLDLEVRTAPAPRVFLKKTGGVTYARAEAKEWMSGNYDNLLWSIPILEVNDVVFSRASDPVEFDTLSSLAGKRVGCITNYVYPKLQSLFDSGLSQRYDVNSEQLLFRMLHAGRIDVAVMDQALGKWIMRTEAEFGVADYFISSTPVNSVGLRFVFTASPGMKERMPQINERIRRLRESGEMERIVSYYE
jgi:polar amino acid transport system substrate-binding protein